MPKFSWSFPSPLSQEGSLSLAATLLIGGSLLALSMMMLHHSQQYSRLALKQTLTSDEDRLLTEVATEILLSSSPPSCTDDPLDSATPTPVASGSPFEWRCGPTPHSSPTPHLQVRRKATPTVPAGQWNTFVATLPSGGPPTPPPIPPSSTKNGCERDRLLFENWVYEGNRNLLLKRTFACDVDPGDPRCPGQRILKLPSKIYADGSSARFKECGGISDAGGRDNYSWNFNQCTESCFYIYRSELYSRISCTTTIPVYSPLSSCRATCPAGMLLRSSPYISSGNWALGESPQVATNATQDGFVCIARNGAITTCKGFCAAFPTP